LTAAYYLRKVGGHSVTVFEASPKAGGMMREGIPEYRLPREILDAEIEDIKNVGVELKTNTKIKSLDELFNQGFNSVFLATGAKQSIKMGIKGEDVTGVLDGLEYLRDVNSGQKIKLLNTLGLKANEENAIVVNSDTLATNRDGVYAGGDVVSGPTSVILAIVAGRKAASSIDKFLGGSGVIDENLASWRLPVHTTWKESILDIPRTEMPSLDNKKDEYSFTEVELGFTKEMAMIEANRCLKCNQRIQVRVNVERCRNCSTCQMVCSLTYRGVFNPSASNIVIEPNKITYKDSCIPGCSLCIDYCPYGALEPLA
jgi:NADPH-dependent glutamate synthase beta subunit-like oxidoreductase